MNDEQIRNFFHSRRPLTGDEGTYLAGLAAKLEAVEAIKRLQEQSVKRYKKTMAWTIAGGIVLSSILTAFFIFHPVDIPSVQHYGSLPAVSSIKEAATTFVDEWRIVLIVAISAISIILGLIPWKKPLT